MYLTERVILLEGVILTQPVLGKRLFTMMSPGSSNIKITCELFVYLLVFITGAWGDCNAPEKVEFAEQATDTLDKASFPTGSVVTYSCQPGYKRITGTTVTSKKCLPDNTWSQLDVFCERKSCRNPGDILNGDIEATDFLFGSRVIFKCNDGFRLTTKRNYSDCLADGTWSNPLPECEVVICPAPNSPPDGSFDPYKDEYTYLDAVTFSCNKGLVLAGEPSASCTANGSWSSSSPTCVVVQCSDPYVPHSKRLSGFMGPYSLYSAVVFECDNGYVMNGSSSITCKINSQWEPKVPECLSVCAPPPILLYAELDEGFSHLLNYFSGMTVLYNCKEGFEHDRNKKNTVTCDNKLWDVSENFCIRKSCGDPGHVKDATMSAKDFLFGSRANYLCTEGYAMLSDTYRECQADGTWSRADIVCTAVCNPPPTLSNAELVERFADLPNYFNAMTAEYNCKHDPNQKIAITCLGKIWSNPKEVCPQRNSIPIIVGNPRQILLMWSTLIVMHKYI
ncbi:complement receptor type 1-like isoform X2 [Pseudophryne corroboree]|uniref:complement receptor type 1-like isoform X2 n=1 Tax=Pseudophryne corroboree TaxID=495146 RepID=UPI0030812C50